MEKENCMQCGKELKEKEKIIYITPNGTKIVCWECDKKNEKKGI